MWMAMMRVLLKAATLDDLKVVMTAEYSVVMWVEWTVDMTDVKMVVEMVGGLVLN